jgi:hypothetical protein
VNGTEIANLLSRRPRGDPYDEARRLGSAVTTLRELVELEYPTGGERRSSREPWTAGRLDRSLLGSEPAGLRRSGRAAPLSAGQFPRRVRPCATVFDDYWSFASFCRHGVHLLKASKAFRPAMLEEPLRDIAPSRFAFVQAVDREFRKLSGGIWLEEVLGWVSMGDSIYEWSNGVATGIYALEDFNDDHVSGLLELLENCRDCLRDTAKVKFPKGQPEPSLKLPEAAAETLFPPVERTKIAVRTDGGEEAVPSRDRLPDDEAELRALEAAFTHLVRGRKWKCLGRDWERALAFLTTWHGMIYDMSEVDCDIDYFGGLASVAEECLLLGEMRKATWPLIKRCEDHGGGGAFWQDLARRIKRAKT